MSAQTTIQPAASPPPLNIPPSDVTVKVFLIDSTAKLSALPVSMMVQPQYKGYDFMDAAPCLAFLIEHPSGKRVMFDLGVRKDWKTMAPSVHEVLKRIGCELTVKKDVAEILQEHGVELDSVDAIIWRCVGLGPGGFSSHAPVLT